MKLIKSLLALLALLCFWVYVCAFIFVGSILFLVTIPVWLPLWCLAIIVGVKDGKIDINYTDKPMLDYGMPGEEKEALSEDARGSGQSD